MPVAASVRKMLASAIASSVVGLRASRRSPLAVAGRGHRVDREHRPPAGAQRGDQQPARGLDRDRDRPARAVAVLGEHPGQSGEPARVVADALFGHQTPITADDRDVMMPFSPVDSAVAIQSSTSINSGVPLVRTPDENAQRPTYEPLGLASDELFAIPAHPHGAGLSQSSMALDKIGGVWSCERAQTTSNPTCSCRPDRDDTPCHPVGCWRIALPPRSRSAKRACSSSERRADQPRTKPVDRPTRGPVLTRRPRQSAHRSRISKS